jgi:hypothetical protein
VVFDVIYSSAIASLASFRKDRIMKRVLPGRVTVR